MVIFGRSKKEEETYGREATVFLGSMLRDASKKVFLDVNRSHIVVISGKRGYGKSYTMGVLAEGILHLPYDLRRRVSVIVIDTMGVFWPMKKPNTEEQETLDKWDLEPLPFDVEILYPQGLERYYSDASLKRFFDGGFVIKPAELSADSWYYLLGIDENQASAVIVRRIVQDLKQQKGQYYGIDEMIDIAMKQGKANFSAVNAVINRLEHIKSMGVFHRRGQNIEDIVKPGQVTIIDTSLFSGQARGWTMREVLVGLLARTIFRKRMEARKKEEAAELLKLDKSTEFPLVWMMIDEAHQFVPSQRTTAATDVLIDWVRQGRQPGLSLVLATQRPGRLHSDVLSQCDILISHRLTAAQDIREIDEKISQTYVTEGRFKVLSDYINSLPKNPGYAVILDDLTETVQRIAVRPRQGKHGGGTAKLIG